MANDASMQGKRYSGLGARLGAGLIDMVVMGLGGGLLGVLVGGVLGQSSEVEVSLGLFAFLFGIAYMILCLSFVGRTIGYAVTGCQLVRADTGTPPSIGSVMIWYLTFGFLGFFGWLWYFFDQRHRMLHNIFSGTVVISPT